MRHPLPVQRVTQRQQALEKAKPLRQGLGGQHRRIPGSGREQRTDPGQRGHTGRVISEALVGGAAVEGAPFTLRSAPAANGFVTTLQGQKVGETPYFDAAGGPGRRSRPRNNHTVVEICRSVTLFFQNESPGNDKDAPAEPAAKAP